MEVREINKRIVTLLLFVMSFSLLTSPVFASQQVFKDVKSNNSHYMGIYTLTHDEVINGYIEKDGSKKYKPDKAKSRMHAAVLFTKALKLSIPNS